MINGLLFQSPACLDNGVTIYRTPLGSVPTCRLGHSLCVEVLVKAELLVTVEALVGPAPSAYKRCATKNGE